MTRGTLTCDTSTAVMCTVPLPLVQISDVLRVHEFPYVRRIVDTCTALPDDTTIALLDADTAVSRCVMRRACRSSCLRCRHRRCDVTLL
jgi:hypothetical protein